MALMLTRSGDGSLSAADRLIIAAAGGRTLDAAELRFVLEHVAQAGFSQGPTTRASGLSGIVWQGRALRGSDRVTAAEYHYLHHVVRFNEWPVETSIEEYLESARAVVLHPDSGVTVSHYRGQLQLSVIGRSHAYQGPDGFPWILVDYRSDIGYWMTAFQPSTGIGVFLDPNRSDLRWLRHQR